MASDMQHRGDNRLWAVLLFAGMILTVTAMRMLPQSAPPVPYLFVQDEMLHLATGNNTSEAGDLKLSGTLSAAATPFFFAPVPVNRAGTSLLMTLPGIGKGLAGKIITFRDKHGPIANMEQFTMVNGIGAKRIEKLQYAITFE